LGRILETAHRYPVQHRRNRETLSVPAPSL
jgi:hypothetical protein